MDGEAVFDGRLNSLYTSADRAFARQDAQRTEHLAREVNRFARPSQQLARGLSLRPLILWRHVATPNFELLRFLELARDLGRPSLVLEVTDDWFTPAVNASKRALGKLAIEMGRTKRGEVNLRFVRLLDFGLTRRRIRDLRCLNGETFIAVHHRLLAAMVGDQAPQIAEPAFGDDGSARSRYERFFALLTCFGVQVEAYCVDGPEGPFTESVVLPAFEATRRRFGAPPMIVRLVPEGTEADPHWEQYPAAVLASACEASRPCRG